jgi:hypothetical protein
MASPPWTPDLEPGPETVSSTSSSSPAPATSTATMTSRAIDYGSRSPVPQNNMAGVGKIFTADFGQALLLVVNTGKRLQPAVTVPVYRPSVHCARRMEQLEKCGGDPKDGDDVLRPLLSPPPGKKPWDDFPRWKEFRWAHPGEAEEDVWERIRRECDALRPRWHAFVPLWRVAVIEERDVSQCQSPEYENDVR